MNIKSLRKKINLSQQKLADLTGIERSKIGKWETGIANPKTEDYKTLEKFFTEQGALEKDSGLPAASSVSLESLDRYLQAVQRQISLNHSELVAEIQKLEEKIDHLTPSELGKQALKEIRQIVDNQRGSMTNKDKKNTTS